MTLAAAALTVVCIGAAFVALSPSAGGCTDSAKDAMAELRLLPDEETDTEVSPETEDAICGAYYSSKSTRPNAVNHYREQLQSHGWKVDRILAGAAAELPRGATWIQAVRGDMCFLVVIDKSEDRNAPTAVNLTVSSRRSPGGC